MNMDRSKYPYRWLAFLFFCLGLSTCQVSNGVENYYNAKACAAYKAPGCDDPYGDKE